MSHCAARDWVSSDDADCDERSERKLGDGDAGVGAAEAAAAMFGACEASDEDTDDEEEVEPEEDNGRNDDAAARNGCCADHGERMVGADEDEPSRRRAKVEGPLGMGEGDMDERVVIADA